MSVRNPSLGVLEESKDPLPKSNPGPKDKSNLGPKSNADKSNIGPNGDFV